MGLYSYAQPVGGGQSGYYGQLWCYDCASPGNKAFSNGQLADLLITRDASGHLSAYVNGILNFNFDPTDARTTFSGPDNIIWFFMDDYVTSPTHIEGGSGYIESISITVPNSVPLPGALPLFATGLGVLGLLGWRRKRKQL